MSSRFAWERVKEGLGKKKRWESHWLYTEVEIPGKSVRWARRKTKNVVCLYETYPVSFLGDSVWVADASSFLKMRSTKYVKTGGPCCVIEVGVKG